MTFCSFPKTKKPFFFNSYKKENKVSIQKFGQLGSLIAKMLSKLNFEKEHKKMWRVLFNFSSLGGCEWRGFW